MWIDHMWLNYIYAFTAVLQRTSRCPLFLLQQNDPYLFWSSFLIHCLSPVFRVIYRANSRLLWSTHSLQKPRIISMMLKTSEKKGAVIKMIMMMKERKFIKSLIGIMFIDKLESQSLSLYTLSFDLKQTHPRTHWRLDSQSCWNFFGNLIDQQNITII